MGQKEPPRLGNTICYGQTWARKIHRDSAVRFDTAKSWPERALVRLVTAKNWKERATETRQYDLLRPRVGQKEPPRLGTTICYGQELARKSHQDPAVRFVTAKGCGQRSQLKIRCARGRRDRFVRTSTGCGVRSERAMPCKKSLGSLRICSGQVSGQKEPWPRLGSTIRLRPRGAQKEGGQDSAVRFA